MALDLNLSKATAKAALDSIVDELDTGTGTSTIKIKSGAQAASPDAAHTSNTLVTINLPDPCFAAATTGAGGDASYIIAQDTFATLTGTAGATGTAAWFRATNNSGTAKIDGTVGLDTGTFDLELNNTSITSGQQVQITSWKIRLPYK